MAEDDIAARVRNLETNDRQHAVDIAGLQSDVKNQGELVRAVAPVVHDLATVRGLANDNKDAIRDLRDEVEEDRRERQKDSDDRRRFNVATAVSVAVAVIALAGVVLTLIQLTAGAH